MNERVDAHGRTLYPWEVQPGAVPVSVPTPTDVSTVGAPVADSPDAQTPPSGSSEPDNADDSDNPIVTDKVAASSDGSDQEAKMKVVPPSTDGRDTSKRRFGR